jgi:hypothetical protein
VDESGSGRQGGNLTPDQRRRLDQLDRAIHGLSPGDIYNSLHLEDWKKERLEILEGAGLPDRDPPGLRRPPRTATLHAVFVAAIVVGAIALGAIVGIALTRPLQGAVLAILGVLAVACVYLAVTTGRVRVRRSLNDDERRHGR